LQIIQCPAPLEVLTLRACEIEQGNWAYMVNVPSAIIVPGHSGLELIFQMLPQIRNGITNKCFPPTTLACLQTLSNASADIPANSIFRFL